MKRKPILRLGALLLAVPLLLTGCSRQETVTVLRQWDPPAQEVASSTAQTAIRVGMVADVSGIDDESFNQGAWEGLQALNQETGAPVEYRLSDSPQEYGKNFKSLVDSGVDLSWGVGYDLADAVLQAASLHPEKSFAIVDNAYEEIPDNVTCVTFRAEEPSFLVGFIAARTTKTGKIGFVGGMEGENIAAFQYGYQAGAAMAAEQYGLSVEVLVEYAGSYTDPDKGRELALAMYDQGCDIVYHAAGGTGVGVIQAAEEADAFAIGVDRDQAYLSPEHVLTSAVKNVGVAVNRVSQTFINGGKIGGQVLSFGLAEGAAGIPETHDLYDGNVYDDVLLVQDNIVSGEVTPPSNVEEYDEFLNWLNRV